MTPPPYSPPSSPPPGWYDDGTGQQRYWDGERWTTHVTSTPPPNAPNATLGAVDDTTMATIVHIAALFSWFLGPLVIYLIRGKDSAFVRHHAVEALNFGITVAIAAFVAGLSILLLVGLVLLPLVLIASWVLPILAAIAASRGEWYHYPMTLRLIPGAL